MQADITALKTRMLASDLSFLYELNTLLHLLSLTHHSLSSLFPLPPFSQMASHVFGSEQTVVGENVFCQWMVEQVKKVVTEGEYDQESDVSCINDNSNGILIQ